MTWTVPSVDKPKRDHVKVAGGPLLHDSAHPDYRRENPTDLCNGRTLVFADYSFFLIARSDVSQCHSAHSLHMITQRLAHSSVLQKSGGAQSATQEVDDVQLVHYNSQWNATPRNHSQAKARSTAITKKSHYTRKLRHRTILAETELRYGVYSECCFHGFHHCKFSIAVMPHCVNTTLFHMPTSDAASHQWPTQYQPIAAKLSYPHSNSRSGC